MSATAKSASKSVTIQFTSRGAYSAMMMSDTGDLFQMYSGSASSPNFVYPTYSTSNPATLRLTVVNARNTSAVDLTSKTVVYYCCGVQLAFNSSGACTTTTNGFNNIFRLNGKNLQVIGSLCGVAGGAGFNIQAKVMMGTTSNADYVVANCPVEIGPYVSGSSTKVTIAPGDSKNFTITANGGSVILTARIFEKGAWVSNYTNYNFKWEQFTGGSWVSIGSAQTLTVSDSMVDTYSLFRVTVTTKAGGQVGSDTQTVLDASDPYDILVSAKKSENGTTETATTDFTLEDTLPDAAYINFTPTMVRRGSTTSIGGTFTSAPIISGDGVKVGSATKSGNDFKVTVATLRALQGVGEYQVIFTGTL